MKFFHIADLLYKKLKGFVMPCSVHDTAQVIYSVLHGLLTMIHELKEY